MSGRVKFTPFIQIAAEATKVVKIECINNWLSNVFSFFNILIPKS